MKVLLTGATGFIGGHFLEYITPIYGRENIVLLSSRPVAGYACVLHKGYSFTKEDFLENGADFFDVVYHLGGAVPKTKSENAIGNIAALADNVLCAKHLLDNLPCVPKKIVFASTVSVYKDEGKTISESSPYAEKDLYGISKLMAESVFERAAKERGFVLQILRLGQIYGEGEEVYEKIVSSFLKRLMAGEPIKIWGDGNALRSNLYVKDVAKYIYEASLLGSYKGPVNICSSRSASLRELFEICSSLVPGDVSYDPTKTAGDVVYDTKRMREFFPDIKEMPLEEGVKNLCEYLKKKNAGC